MSSTLPSLFVGSSAEGLPVASAIASAVSGVCVSRLWTDGVFKPGSVAVDALVSEASKHDFAIFILTADDVVSSRGRRRRAPRDNVVFEFGMFLGSLGRHRAFGIVDASVELKVPSDFAGVTVLRYTPAGKGVAPADLSHACEELKAAVNTLGPKRIINFERLYHHTTEKKTLAAFAAGHERMSQLVQFLGSDPVRIGFGPGSTPYFAATELLSRFKVHTITDNVLIIQHLLATSYLLTVVGGLFDSANQSLVLPSGEFPYTHVNVISCAGISMRRGEVHLHCYSKEHEQVLRTMVGKSHERDDSFEGYPSLLIVADQSKLWRPAYYTYARGRDLPSAETMLITRLRGKNIAKSGVGDIEQFIGRGAKK